MRKLLLLSLFAISFASLNGVAANLVVNGDFETGNFAGWTTHDCVGGCFAVGWRVQSGAGVGGSFGAGTPCVNAICNDPVVGDWFSQTLATDPSQLYSLSFAYNSVSGPTTQLDVY